MKSSVLPFLVCILAIIALSPYLITGYYFDDSLNASYAQNHLLTFSDFWLYFVDRFKVWTLLEGRFFPLGNLCTISIFYFFKSLTSYRLAQVSLTGYGIFLFYRWLRSFKVSYSDSLLFISLCFTLFQIRNYHDPMTSYGCLLQFSFIFGIGSLLVLNRYIEKARSFDLFLTFLFSIACLLTYETNIIFILIALIVCFLTKKYQLLSGFLLLLGMYLGTTLYLRMSHPPRYSGVQVALGFGALKTYFSQLSAAFPLSYPIFGRVEFVRIGTLIDPEFLSLRSLFIFLFSSWSFFEIFKKSKNQEVHYFSKQLMLSSSILLFASPFLVSISKKYQIEVGRVGHAYLPVFFSYFGLSILLGVFLLNRQKISAFWISSVFGFIFTLNFTVNWITAQGMNEFWKKPRLLLEQAASSGALRPLCESKELVHHSRYYWINSDLISSLCKKSVDVKDLHYLIANHIPVKNLNYFTFEIQSCSGSIGFGTFESDLSNLSQLPKPKTIWSKEVASP